MRHTFQTEQWVPHPIAEVFAFFANPKNLPRLMPGWQRARIDRSLIVEPPSANSGVRKNPTAAAGAGSRMYISFRPVPLSPVRMTWEASIVEFQWDDHFCDEQLKGPFAYWRHCHRVCTEERDSVAGTNVVDDLVYELPWGMLSGPAHALFIRRQIQSIFAFRQKQLLKLL